MTWRDARVQAPPDGERVLVAYAGVCFAEYNAWQSNAKGCALPNPTATAVWCINSLEGRRTIRYWMPLPDVPKDAE